MNDGRHFVYDNGQSFIGSSRATKRAMAREGVILKDGSKAHVGRSKVLSKIDKYLKGIQYENLQDWESECKLKDKKPLLIYPFIEVFGQKVGTKLLGSDVFPSLSLEEDQDTQYFINKVIVPSSNFKPMMQSMAETLSIFTSCFVRFKISGGKLKLENYEPNYCYPEFDDAGELDFIEIKYVYEDKEDLDPVTKAPKLKWYRITLSREADTLYDNPDYNENEEEPTFKVVSKVEHGLGFVQGEWVKSGENRYTPDGKEKPILFKMLAFIDALNYNISLSDKAVNYGTDPQLIFTGMTNDEAENLIKSSSKYWDLGHDGTAQFAEISGVGAQRAKEQREDYKQMFQDIARIVLLDPEKMVGSAQSGKAMEVLHTPLVELVNSMRPWVEQSIKKLLTKMTVTILMMRNMGLEVAYNIPDNYVPKSFEFEFTWPNIFPLTVGDEQQLVSMFVSLTSSNILSRDTALRELQARGVKLGVQDFALEEHKINNQKEFNSFTF